MFFPHIHYDVAPLQSGAEFHSYQQTAYRTYDVAPLQSGA
jgi:hypothetical protein